MRVPFQVVLEFLESRGWALSRIWKPYRVFIKEGELPILVEVHDGSVEGDDFDYIRRIA